ncbi:MAG: excalibur calcium-binding domain-containing protein [Pseudomonadota bacterium]
MAIAEAAAIGALLVTSLVLLGSLAGSVMASILDARAAKTPHVAALAAFRARQRREARLERRRHRPLWRDALILLSGAALGYGATVAEERLPWPAMVTLRHTVAVLDCRAAALVGLAPARAGAPGYAARLDADGDGLSCEG